MTVLVKSVALAITIALGSLVSVSAQAAILRTGDGASVATKDGAAVLTGIVASAEACDQVAALADDHVVYFNFDKSGLTKQAKNQLRHLAKKIRNSADKTVSIAGYADRMGNVTYNEKLALRRAKAVHDYLIAAGLKAKKVEVRSFGKSDPKSNCAEGLSREETISCLAVDRRVEIDVK